MLFQAELGSAQQLEQLFKTWQVDEADRTQQQFKKLEVSPEGLKVWIAQETRMTPTCLPVLNTLLVRSGLLAACDIKICLRCVGRTSEARRKPCGHQHVFSADSTSVVDVPCANHKKVYLQHGVREYWASNICL